MLRSVRIPIMQDLKTFDYTKDYTEEDVINIGIKEIVWEDNELIHLINVIMKNIDKALYEVGGEVEAIQVGVREYMMIQYGLSYINNRTFIGMEIEYDTSKKSHLMGEKLEVVSSLEGVNIRLDTQSEIRRKYL